MPWSCDQAIRPAMWRCSKILRVLQQHHIAMARADAQPAAEETAGLTTAVVCYVRFAPESGQIADASVCPLCANRGQMHRNKRRARIVEIYSVTSSRDRTPAISRNG